jgi:hypothetical protein
MPPSIRTFERMQIVALAVGWIYATLIYRTTLHDQLSPILFAMALITASVVVVILIFLISRRRSTWAKWSLIVLSAAATAPWAALAHRAGVANWLGVLALFQAGLQIVSLFYLIHPASRAWFASRVD